MRNISERDMAVCISLLASKIREMEQTLSVEESAGDELDDEQMSERYELQECIEQYKVILGTLRPEYENGLESGINLPGFDELTQAR